MTRQRAGAANRAFSKVATAEVPDSVDESIPASDNEVMNADTVASKPEGNAASKPASKPARKRASRKPRPRPETRVNGEPYRGKPGRPAGPTRHVLSVRILTETDRRLTAAVARTGERPQTIVEAALTAYFDALGITE